MLCTKLLWLLLPINHVIFNFNLFLMYVHTCDYTVYVDDTVAQQTQKQNGKKLSICTEKQNLYSYCHHILTLAPQNVSHRSLNLQALLPSPSFLFLTKELRNFLNTVGVFDLPLPPEE